MISHRPYGSGHPYATSPDQRVPSIPEAGESVRLGVSAPSTVSGIRCEWHDTSHQGGATTTLALTPVALDPQHALVAAGGEGHLDEVQTQGEIGAGQVWAVDSPPTVFGHRYRYRFHYTETGATHRTRWYAVEPVRWTTDHPRGELEIDADRLVAGSVSWRGTADGTADRVRFALRLSPGEHVVGFGERFDRLDQRGHRLDTVVFEQYKSQGRLGRTYLPMPFAHVIGGDGWGFHVRSSRRCWFDIGATVPDAIWIEAGLGPDQQLSVATYGGTPEQVLAAFRAETGPPVELPSWVFRLWASGNEWNTQRIVMARMDAHRDLDIPVGTVVIEAWSDEATFTAFRDARYQPTADGSPHTATDFTYPPGGAWPDPKGMIDELHRRDIRVVLWQIPLQRMQPRPVGQAKADAEALVRNGFTIDEANGRPYRNRGWWFPRALMPDFTDPEASQWWTDKRRYLVRDLGVDGFKTDGGEHAWGHDLRYRDGRRGNEANNLFPVSYAAAFGDLLRSENKAPVTFSRAGFTGSAAHGIIWAGDENSTWEAFRWSLTAGLAASASGILYWGWDIAGFSGPLPDPELYLRAAATSVFVPIMQYHSEFHHHRPPCNDRTPWNVAAQTGDDRIVPMFRDAVHLRQRLIPYLTEQAAEAIRTGTALMRALCLDWPDDPRVWDHPLEYLLGDDLLIVPVTEPDTTVQEVYLPTGDWTDVWTGDRVHGPAVLSRDVPIPLLPVYCAAPRWPTLRHIFATAEFATHPGPHAGAG